MHLLVELTVDCVGGVTPPPVVPPVTPPATSCTDDSLVTVTQPLPATMTPGQTASFIIRAKDTGNSRWYHGSVYKLLKKSGNLNIISTAPSSVAGVDYGHIPLGSDPFDYIDWTFKVTAPSVFGDYIANLQMLHTTYAGAEYIKTDGSTCPGPSSDTYFGGIGTIRTTVVANSTLTITKAGNGSGAVTSVSSSGINCGSTCSAEFAKNSNVTLSAVPTSGSVFTDWSGDCNFLDSGSNVNGGVNMNSNKTCTATFSLMAPGPDLTASNPSPTTAVVGTEVTLSSIISNIGIDSTVGGFKNLFQISTNPSDETTITEIGSTNMAVLASGGTRTATYPDYRFNNTGIYFIRVCADLPPYDFGVIDESNENNNCGGWSNIVVNNGGGEGGNGPDLTASNVFPVNAVVGVPIKFSSTVKNTGNMPTK